VRRVRRELEAARETLRRELGHEPSLADLAKKVGTDEKRLGRTIVRIHTIESTSPLATSETVDEACLPTALVPSEPEAPDAAYERTEMQDRVRAAIGSLPPREQKVISLYYYGDVTMKQIGAEIGVNESRVSQLHARAIKRLRTVLADMAPAEAMSALKSAVLAFHQKPVMAKASLPAERVAASQVSTTAVAAKTAPVVAFKAAKANVRRPFMSPRVASTRVSVAAAR
jgi:RNA polymerase sigma factor for flagellar operon FliA